MIRNWKEVAKDAATLLGEGIEAECEGPDSPFPDIEERVKLILPGILADLLLEADIGKISGWKRLPAEDLEITKDGTGSLSLPVGFLRLGTLRFQSWRRSLHGIADERAVKASFQASQWPGIKGCPSRPVITQGIGADGNRCLKIYGCITGDRLTEGWYLPYPEYDAGGCVEIPETLYSELLQKVSGSLIQPLIR